ncbi:flavoprotein [Dictyobacter vulcani]|uniref:Flavoprotein n=1 Tax=Dictyobacter vulcani TaxID=2607529 RepID=A0A5J4KG35_9CHLR|nr:flavoprotein [Dictyobacter vulcani]GER88414.1 flavoprotein [Dictyobacter vulcani]
MRKLAVVVCAALSARYIQEFVRLAQKDRWDVWIVATPKACDFIDEPVLHALTDHPITVTEPALPLPTFDAVVVVPATFNSLKKWAQGILDTYALVLLHTWMRQPQLPILVFPRASSELAQEPAFAPSLAWLQQQGIHVYYDPDLIPPTTISPGPPFRENCAMSAHDVWLML